MMNVVDHDDKSSTSVPMNLNNAQQQQLVNIANRVTAGQPLHPAPSPPSMPPNAPQPTHYQGADVVTSFMQHPPHLQHPQPHPPSIPHEVRGTEQVPMQHFQSRTPTPTDQLGYMSLQQIPQVPPHQVQHQAQQPPPQHHYHQRTHGIPPIQQEQQQSLHSNQVQQNYQQYGHHQSQSQSQLQIPQKYPQQQAPVHQPQQIIPNHQYQVSHREHGNNLQAQQVTAQHHVGNHHHHRRQQQPQQPQQQQQQQLAHHFSSNNDQHRLQQQQHNHQNHVQQPQLRDQPHEQRRQTYIQQPQPQLHHKHEQAHQMHEQYLQQQQQQQQNERKKRPSSQPLEPDMSNRDDRKSYAAASTHVKSSSPNDEKEGTLKTIEKSKITHAGDKQSNPENMKSSSSAEKLQSNTIMFYNFLLKLSAEIEKAWTRFKQFVRHARIHGTNSNPQIAEIMMSSCQAALQLLTMRKEKGIADNKIDHGSTLRVLLEETSKIIHMDIIFLKKGSGKSIKDLGQVCLISQDDAYHKELENMKKLSHRVLDFEKAIANARSKVQKYLASNLVTSSKESKESSAKNTVVNNESKDPSAKHNAVNKESKESSAKHTAAVTNNGTNGIKISGSEKGTGKTKHKDTSTSTKKNSTGKRKKRTVDEKDKKKVSRPKISKQSSVAHGVTGEEEASKKSHSNGPNATIVDIHSDRLVNPLLEIPQGSMTGDPTLPVSEFLKLMEIYLPEPDTYPLSYYGKLLGIRVPMTSNEKSGKVVTNAKSKRKDDGWAQIPELGDYGREPKRLRNETLASIDVDGSRSNHDIDNVDPMWYTILNEYRGYRDDDLKQASEFNKPCLISADCLTLARKLDIIGHNIRFRIATVEDAQKINSINEGNGMYSNRARLCTIIKGGNHFIILATRADDEILGFLHYQFCWFRPKVRNVLTSEEVALERVLHIESIQFRRLETDEENRIKSEGLEYTNECIILFALAFEHARLYTMYGMMDLEPDYVSVLKKYFRVSEVTSDFDHALLACDLQKCSYKYALHLRKEESLKMTVREHMSRHRLLVQLPTSRLVPSVSKMPGLSVGQNLNSRVTSDSKDVSSKIKHDPTNTELILQNQIAGIDTKIKSPGSETCTSNLAEAKAVANATLSQDTNPRREMPTDDTFSGNNQAVTQKTISVRVERNIVKVTKCPAIRSPQKGSKQRKSSRMLSQSNWNTVSCFCIAGDSGKSHLTKNSDTIVTNLKGLQQDLAALESNNFFVLERLMHSVIKERAQYELDQKKRALDAKFLKEYETEVQRRIDAQKKIEKQIEEDDNAVCDICGDGESTGENRIIFCDSCDVSVHQHCYGVDVVPRGDYFCRACQYFKNKKDPLTPQQTLQCHQDRPPEKPKKFPPITCELCPKKHGAFVQTQTFPKAGQKNARSQWVHFLCAKWQGLSIVEGAMENGVAVFLIENVQPLKDHFRLEDISCFLCKGKRGSYNKCRHEGCDRWMHVTCARSSGICEVVHGDNHIGPVESENVWTLCCPEHSKFDEDYSPPTNKVSIDELVAIAKTYPVESKPTPPPVPPKPFYKLSGKERRKRLNDPEYEKQFVNLLMTKEIGLRCEVCDGICGVGTFHKCAKCSSVAHKECCTENKWEREQITKDVQQYTCTSCSFAKNHEHDDIKNGKNSQLKCHMCFSKHGTLIPCSAKPVTMKKWKQNMKQFKKTLFGRDIWCHPVCGVWNRGTIFNDDGSIDCSNIIMAHGIGHVDGKKYCSLCGRKDGAKNPCAHITGNKHKQCPMRFHPTCGREAGFDVTNDHPLLEISNMCFVHGRCEYAFRAMLEDMIEFEKVRAGNDLKKSGGSMSLESATNIFNAGVRVLRCLGWAWRWAEWWVHYGDNWEPLLEEGQKESDMSNMELKIIESSPMSRRADARKCRLAAFGAALRNRSYDSKPGDDRVPLQNALRAILSTKSLVGPLTKTEIDFYIEWLGRVYRSKSPSIRLGEDRMPVNEEWAPDSPVFHRRDKSPKYELGDRMLPGKSLKKGLIFEEIDEIDDFFENDEDLAILHLPVPAPKAKIATAKNPGKKVKTSKAKATVTKKTTSTTSTSTRTSNKSNSRRKILPSSDISTNLGDDHPIQSMKESEISVNSVFANRLARRRTNNSLSTTAPTDPIVLPDEDVIVNPDANRNPSLEDRIPKKRRRS